MRAIQALAVVVGQFLSPSPSVPSSADVTRPQPKVCATVTGDALAAKKALSAWTRWHSVSTGGEVAPDGTATAYKMTADSGGVFAHGAYVDFSVTAGNELLTVWAKAGTRSWLWLSISTGGQDYWTSFDLSTCAVGSAGSGNTVSASKSRRGYCRIDVGRAVSTETRYATVSMSATGVSQQSTDDGTGTIYLWSPTAVSGAAAPTCP